MTLLAICKQRIAASSGEAKLTITKGEGSFGHTNSLVILGWNKGTIEFSDGKIVFISLTGLLPQL